MDIKNDLPLLMIIVVVYLSNIIDTEPCSGTKHNPDHPEYYNGCNLTKDCPNNCSCIETRLNDTFYVDCRAAGLTEFPEVLPDTGRSKIELFLENNFVRSITNTSYLKKVYNLSMSNNRLLTLDEEVLREMSNIRYLDVRNNRIQALPSYIQRFSYDDVKLLGNPLFCDCDSFWLADWVGSSISRSATLTCDSETGVHLVTEITQDSLDCTRNGKVMLLIVMVILIAFAVTILLIIVCKYPYEAKVLLNKFLRIHPCIYDEDESMEVDIYLVFDDKPCVIAWVKRFLVPLGKTKPYYTIINPHSFIQPVHGEEEIKKGIQKSKRILVILSEGIFDNNWRMFEIAVAEDNLITAMGRQHPSAIQPSEFNEDSFEHVQAAGKIIYVKYSENMTERLNEEQWHTRMAGKPVLDVKDKMFMSKLRYELPQKGNRTKPKLDSRMRAGRHYIQMPRATTIDENIEGSKALVDLAILSPLQKSCSSDIASDQPMEIFVCSVQVSFYTWDIIEPDGIHTFTPTPFFTPGKRYYWIFKCGRIGKTPL